MDYQRVHCIGIGGIGVSAVAKLLKLRGVHVSGSDVTESPMLDALRHLDIPVWVGSRPDRIGKDVDVVVYSSAVPDTDEELIRARHLGAREVVYNAFLGELTEGMQTIAVTGTHGKSTTTALVGHVLASVGLDPTVIVGSKVSTFKHGNLRVGRSGLMVVEACEHMAHMLYVHPTIAVVTNVEFDHPDYYRDLAHVQEKMQAFVERVPADGLVVWNAQDEPSMAVRARTARVGQEVTVGEGGALWARTEQQEGMQLLHVYRHEDELGDLLLPLPGAYNVQNALMALAVVLELGVPFERAARAFETFPGLWRRFEALGSYNGAEVFTDYAHHPTAVRALLEAARARFPGRRLVLCFQPHQPARTRGLFDDFVEAMDEADALVLPEIYGVTGRNDVGEPVSSADLLRAIEQRDQARGVDRTLRFVPELAQVPACLAELVQSGDVLLMTGAGEIDALARTLTDHA